MICIVCNLPQIYRFTAPWFCGQRGGDVRRIGRYGQIYGHVLQDTQGIAWVLST